MTTTITHSHTSSYTKLREAKQTLKAIKTKAATIRDTFFSDLAEHHVATHKAPTHLQALKWIINAKAHRDVFRKVKNALNPMEHSVLSRLEVPSNSITSDTDHSPNLNIHHYPSQSDTWIPVTTKSNIEAHLIKRNATHYRQANLTPFGTNHHGNANRYHGTNEVAAAILDGTYGTTPTALTPETKAYLLELQYHPNVQSGDLLTTKLSTQDIQRMFSTWRESTSTSP